MFGRVERARLAAIPLLAGLPDDELDAVARVASELELPAGKELTIEGDFGHAVFAIEERLGGNHPRRNAHRVVGPGDIVGEIAVLASGRRTASVRATSALKVIALFKRDVWQLERDAPEASRRLREALDEHVDAQRPLNGVVEAADAIPAVAVRLDDELVRRVPVAPRSRRGSMRFARTPASLVRHLQTETS